MWYLYFDKREIVLPLKICKTWTEKKIGWEWGRERCGREWRYMGMIMTKKIETNKKKKRWIKTIAE
jgi:hypothetical protein